MLSCAGVGLYLKVASGIESKACAMLRCRLAVLLREEAVIGFGGRVPGAGCCALSAIGVSTATTTKRDTFIWTSGYESQDLYSVWTWHPQPLHAPVPARPTLIRSPPPPGSARECR